LHEVSKWTVPSRCSDGSWAKADGTKAAAKTTAKAGASDDLIMVAFLFVVFETRQTGIDRTLPKAPGASNL
jgi:hypothetical protein